jgi:hypothetical protein
MSQQQHQEGLSKDGILAAVEEAKDAPTLFNPRERKEYVLKRVEEARKLRALGQNDEQIKAVMGNFVKDYPTLFSMAMEPRFDQTKFNLMIGLLDKMDKGGMTQHQASVIDGQHLVDTIIKPQIEGKKKGV